MTSTKELKLKNGKLPLQNVIGSVFGQTITGTLIKQKVLEEKPKYRDKRYFIVENVTTGFRQLICEDDLHCL